MSRPQVIAGLLSLAFLFSASASRAAEDQYYGTVESFGGGTLVIKTTKKSTGTWKVDGATKVIGNIQPADWVFVDVEASGHIKKLQFEERPAPRSGTVKDVKGIVLHVASGTGVENWNMVPTTIYVGVSPGEVKKGDVIRARLYKNHNLAELSK